ncbi:MAG: TatD family hydrolase [Planctomycetota bacterium]
MIDTHCHLTYPGFHDRLPAVLTAARDAGLAGMISVGTSPADATAAQRIAQREPDVWFTAGIHPLHSDEITNPDAAIAHLRQLLTDPHCVALGELGLDNHYPTPPPEVQLPILNAQLQLANELPDTPIVIHNRKATDQTLAVLREHHIPGPRCVFHCFTGSADELDAILDYGAMVSLTGIVTFKSAAGLADASDRIPLDRLMVETDSPYLTPAPHRKIKTNEPKYVTDVARFLADRRGMTYADFESATDANAHRFFNLSASAPLS